MSSKQQQGPERRSVNTEGFAHVNPVPVASRIGQHLQSGVLTGRDLATRAFPESLDEQVRIVFQRIAELMTTAGGTTDDILKVHLWVVRFRDREAINREWEAMFPDPETRPARQIIQADLDEGALIQADIVAVLPATGPASAASSAAPPAAVAADEGDFVLTPELRAQLEATPVSTLSASLRKRGYIETFIDGVATNQPGRRIVGQARTLRLIPFRPDLFKAHAPGFNAQKRAFDGVNEGEILVVDARGIPETGTVGDILAMRAKVRGAAGIVTDGGVRDWAAVQEIGIPVFSNGAHPSVLGRRHVPWEIDVTIACGGAAVQPGDVLVGDDDGVIVIPPALVAEIVAEAAAQEAEDAWVFDRVAAGEPVDGLFPPSAANRARYEAETGRP